MLHRVTSGPLALAVVLTSGVVGSTGFLCRMNGDLHAERCCAGGGDYEDRGDQLKRDDECCELYVSDAKHPPATVDRARAQLPLPLLLGTSAVVVLRPPKNRMEQWVQRPPLIPLQTATVVLLI